MSFGFGRTDKDGNYVDGMRVGTNGSQSIMAALWFAAYAVADRLESKRVCAWVDRGWTRWVPMHPEAPRAVRNKPRTVEALIAFNYEESEGTSTAVCPQDDTITLGLKFKPVRDPLLAALVELWRRTCDPSDYAGTFSVDEVQTLAHAFETLLPRLTPSCWFETMKEIRDLFRSAADVGDAVHYG